ncbi:hypothetical protein LPJ78_001989 [Coemansia sp. RSA 989]|nr:hypothetical protein LPJ78_001989 [Coemansia sp. RSA 989]
MFGIGGVLTSSLSGFVSDRLQSRKLPLVLGSIGYAICGCILFFSHKLWHLLLYRLLNGMASGLVYPISTAAVGDVYPHKLLGVQMALLNMFNNAGYMIGPIIGGALYDRAGVQGVSTVIITIGSALSLFMALGIKEPLLIHTRLLEQRGIESISDTESENKTIAEEIDSIDLYPKDMPLWRLVLKWQVMLASIITLSLGTFNSSLDNLLGMHVKDRFHISSSKAGLLYVINGGVSILLSIPTGTAVDRIIGRYGEDARGYIQVFGLLLACGSAFAIGMSKSFGMVAGLEAWIATAVLLVNIPVMSSFGDFVNRLNLNSMAQCYGIFNSFWSLSSSPAKADAVQTIHSQAEQPPFVNHIYCLNAPSKLGRKERMTELFKYMHLDVQMFSGDHLAVWHDIIDKKFEQAMVVEDDIDFELDAVDSIHKALESLTAKTVGWDMLYIGHCSMEEAQPSQNTTVVKSVHPFCTSGYVVSHRGAQKLANRFSQKSSSYALDVQLVALIKRKLLDAYSMYPPVVFQRRDLYPSDDGMELRIFRLLNNSAWDTARQREPRLANWVDPPDAEQRHPAYKYIPKWMEDARTVH